MWHFQQIENWFQLIEKFKHVQTFQLTESKNEWIVFGMKGKIWKEKRKYSANISIELKSSIAYMFQLIVSYN